MCSLDADEARRQTVGGDSVFGAIDIPDIGNESTFVMAPVQSPVRDATTTEGLEDFGSDNAPLDMGVDDDDDVNEPMDMPDFDIEEHEEEAEADEAAENNINTIEETAISRTTSLAPNRGIKRKKGKKISRYGIEYPSLPANVVKRLATTCAKTAGSKGKISPDTLEAIMQATEWFFEQVGDDLSAYAKHAGRKTIDESDMITLMRRYVLIHSFYSVVFLSYIQMLIFHMIQTAANELFYYAIFARAAPFTTRALAGVTYAGTSPE